VDLPIAENKENQRGMPFRKTTKLGPSGRLAGANVRLAAVCAALVSLLAVSCVVLTSGQPTQHGLPGFELSLNSAMETFFKNTAVQIDNVLRYL